MRLQVHGIFFMMLLHEVFAGWSSWANWTSCSETCGPGMRTRQRTCAGKCDGATENDMKIEGTECQLRACPKADDCSCGCVLASKEGYIDALKTFSQPGACTWQLKTAPNTKVKLRVQHIELRQGKIYVMDKNKQYKVITRTIVGSTSSQPFTVTSHSNTLNLTIIYDFTHKGNRITVQGSYETIDADPSPAPTKKKDSSSLNAPAVIGITACVIIIIIASIVIGYRKLRRSKEEKSEDEVEEGIEDNYSSASSSNRSGRNKITSPRKSRTTQQRELSPQRSEIEQQRLLATQYSNAQRGFPDGNELYIPQTTNVLVTAQGGFITSQPYVNWPLQQQQYGEVEYYRQAQPMDCLVKQGQVTYAPQVVYDPSHTYHYPTSGGE